MRVTVQCTRVYQDGRWACAGSRVSWQVHEVCIVTRAKKGREKKRKEKKEFKFPLDFLSSCRHKKWRKNKITEKNKS